MSQTALKRSENRLKTSCSMESIVFDQMNDLPVASIENKLEVPGLDVEPGQRQDTIGIEITFACFGKNG